MKRGEAVLEYHERTKHSSESVRSSPHFLDWANQPIPFKIYRDREPAPLPPVGEPEGLPVIEALGGKPSTAGHLTLSALSRLLYHAAGVTKRLRRGGGEMLFRAAACTGALYHVDLYVATGPFDGLDAGLYQYDPRTHGLTLLRPGDWRQSFTAAAANEESVASARAVVALASTYWRNAWKYRARAYRHVFWDGGTILAHLLAEARALELPSRLVLGFVDADVERLLGLNPVKEGAFALVALASDPEPLPPSPAVGDAVAPLDLATEPLSPTEIDHPLIREAHAAGKLSDPDAVAAWRDGVRPLPAAPPLSSDARSIEGVSDIPAELLESVIRRRGSARRFSREPIDVRQLASVLGSAHDMPAGDAFVPGRTWSELYVIVNDVRGLDPGAYVYRRDERSLEPLAIGDFRKQAALLDLEQDLAGDASANVYALVDLEGVVERLGDRGYRVAQLEGGLLGGRMYLAAYALGLAATGLTFYDDAVTEFFSPRAAGKSVMFLLALGVRGKRRILMEQ